MKSPALIQMILFPFAGAIFLGLMRLFVPWFRKEWAGFVACIASGWAFIQAWRVAAPFFTDPDAPPVLHSVGEWILAGDIRLGAIFRIDALSAVMVLIVSGIGFLIHVYSIGYMSDDSGRIRYFSFLNLFLGFMLVLVSASSLPLLFVGWEGVGLCSYLLIGFWFTDTANAQAGKKAFIVNRIGDAGFLLAIFLAHHLFQTFDPVEIASHPAFLFLRGHVLLEMLAILLFVGVIGKSAQLPLYIWLPDAMAGPTPVSALIHAATMVTAGVYLLARFSFLYAVTPMASEGVVWIGCLTALFAAIVATAQTDIKRVLAYSTVSQLGFMVFAMGVGAYGAGMFHLVTHAFFKALLFLAAGSVIHALGGEQNIFNMGGLRKPILKTATLFFIGYISIIGVPGTSGWYSKDEILYHAFVSGEMTPFVLMMIATLLTSFYMTRLFALAFCGERKRREGHSDIHESPGIMIGPMWILAAGALFAGTRMFPFAHHFHSLFPTTEPEGVVISEAKFGWFVSLASLLTAGVAAKFYLSWKGATQTRWEMANTFRGWAENQFGFDSFMTVLGKIVSQVLSSLCRLIDVYWIDGVVNRIAKLIREIGAQVAGLQSGLIQVYALSMAVGLIAMAWFFARGGL